MAYRKEKSNIRLFDAMLAEELYNKHHDDERQMEMDNLDEMMKKVYRLVLKEDYDLLMEELYYHL